MEQQKPLFIYDCDGTLQAMITLVYRQKQQLGLTSLSKEEFIKQNTDSINQNKVMLPGMAEQIKYTAIKGYNVLLSGGAPAQDGCYELRQSLRHYFKNWSYNGKEVEWGRTPDMPENKSDSKANIKMPKERFEVAEGLLQYFSSRRIFVIGDGTDDYDLALNLNSCIKKETRGKEKIYPQPAVVFIMIRPHQKPVLNVEVPVITAQTTELRQLMQAYFSAPQIPESHKYSTHSNDPIHALFKTAIQIYKRATDGVCSDITNTKMVLNSTSPFPHQRKDGQDL